MITRIILVTILSVSSAAAWADDGATQFSVVFRGAIAMEKLPYKGPLVFEVDGEEVYISSCGFANITYRTGPLLRTYDEYSDEDGRPESFMYLMGEFCEVADALLENGFLSLIAYSEREGARYLTSNGAAVYADQDGALYVADAEFVEANELQALARPIAHGDNDEGCLDSEGSDVTEGRVNVAGRWCFATGVYLSDMAEQQGSNNSE